MRAGLAERETGDVPGAQNAFFLGVRNVSSPEMTISHSSRVSS